jgi:hypothetical protein
VVSEDPMTFSFFLSRVFSVTSMDFFTVVCICKVHTAFVPAPLN